MEFTEYQRYAEKRPLPTWLIGLGSFGINIPFSMAMQKFFSSKTWIRHSAIIHVFYALLAVIFIVTVVYAKRRRPLVLNTKGIRILYGRKRVFLPWKDVVQIRLMRYPMYPGIYSPFGMLFFSKKELSEIHWREKHYSNEVAEYMIFTQGHYFKIIGQIRQLATKANWSVVEQDANDTTRQAHRPNASTRYWAVRHARSFYRWSAFGLLYILLSFVQILVPDAYRNFIGWFMLLFTLFYLLILKVGVYYKLSCDGIQKYYFPGIRIRKYRWDDIKEAGITDGMSVYVSTVVPERDRPIEPSRQVADNVFIGALWCPRSAIIRKWLRCSPNIYLRRSGATLDPSWER